MDARPAEAIHINVPDEPLRDVTCAWSSPAHRLVATPRGPALVASRLPLYLGSALLAAYAVAGLLAPWRQVIQYLDAHSFGVRALYLTALPLLISCIGPIACYFVLKALLTRVEFDQVDRVVRFIRPKGIETYPAADLAAVQLCFAVFGRPDSYIYVAYQVVLVFAHGGDPVARICVESTGSGRPARRMALAISEATGVPFVDSATREHRRAEWARCTGGGPGVAATLVSMGLGFVFSIGALFCFGAAAMQCWLAPGVIQQTPTPEFLAIGVALVAALALDIAIWRRLTRARRKAG